MRLPSWVPRERLADARHLRALGKNLAWEGGKLLALVALHEAVKRVRAGPLGLAIEAPLRVKAGESVFVEAVVESPDRLTRCDAYFAGAWQPAASLEAGLRREKWLFRAAETGIRPIVVRARDVGGHVLTRTRWILVLPASTARQITPSAPRTRGGPNAPESTVDA